MATKSEGKTVPCPFCGSEGTLDHMGLIKTTCRACEGRRRLGPADARRLLPMLRADHEKTRRQFEGQAKVIADLEGLLA